MMRKDPIYSLDLDEDLLAHLPNPETWVIINTENIDPSIIEDGEVRDIFNWQRQHIREHGKPATVTVLADEFDLDLREPETAIGDLLDRLRDRYAKNQGRDVLRDIIEAQREDPVAIPQLLLRKGRELGEIITKRGEMFASSDVERAQHRYDKKVLAGRGASVGFPELDEYFFGMRGVTLWIAPPKTMKSWVMCQGVMQNAIDGNYPWLYSLELPADEADMRMRCLLADVPWWRYVRNALTVGDWRKIREASDYLHDTGAYKIVKPAMGHRGIEEIIYQARDGGAGVVFIDQLQYVETSKGLSIGSQNNTGDYWEVLNRARDLSDDGPICFAHQFNRQAMFSDGLPPVEYAKGSSSIEEVATLAVGLWGNREMRSAGRLEVGTLVARNHQYAAWELNFDLADGCSFVIGERLPDETPDDGKS